MRRTTLLLSLALALTAGCLEGEEQDKGKAKETVKLCDNETETEIPAGKRDRALGIKVARSLMEQWRAKNPDVDWAADEAAAHSLVPSYDNSGLVSEGEDQTYGRFTRADIALWKRETERFARAGSRVFHSADELGSTIAVSCDMCHPNAANTHPETYPKYQTQLGRVVLLRDMINWCVEHPVRGQPLDPDGPKMRAIEAYILAQRKGKRLNYGRH